MTTSFSHNDRTTHTERPQHHTETTDHILHQITPADRHAAYQHQDSLRHNNTSDHHLPSLQITDSSHTRGVIPDTVRRHNNAQVLNLLASGHTDIPQALRAVAGNHPGELRGFGIQYARDDFGANQTMSAYTQNALAMVATSRDQTTGATNRLNDRGQLVYGDRIQPHQTYAVDSYDSHTRTVFVRNPNTPHQLESMPLSTFRDNFATFDSYIAR